MLIFDFKLNFETLNFLFTSNEKLDLELKFDLFVSSKIESSLFKNFIKFLLILFLILFIFPITKNLYLFY